MKRSPFFVAMSLHGREKNKLVITKPFPPQILQHDMWGVPDTDHCDWKSLREKIKK